MRTIYYGNETSRALKTLPLFSRRSVGTRKEYDSFLEKEMNYFKRTLYLVLVVGFIGLVELPSVPTQAKETSREPIPVDQQSQSKSIAQPGSAIKSKQIAATPTRGVIMGQKLMEKWQRLSRIDSPSPEVTWLIQHGNAILDEADNYYQQLPREIRESENYSDLVLLRMQGAFKNLLRTLELELASNLSLDDLRTLLQTYQVERDSLEEATTHTRQQLINKAELFLATEENAPQPASDQAREEVIAKVMYHLADLYYLEAEEKIANEYAAYENLVAKLPPDAELPPEPKADFSKSIAAYQKIIDLYPSSPYISDALYNIAVILADMDTEPSLRKARNTLQTLVDNFPDSRYTPEALYRIGDYYFMKKTDPQNAIPFYEKVLEYPESDQYVDALYMLGWCNFFIGNNENYTLAVKYFDETIKYSRTHRTGEKSYGNLVDEAVRYTALTYSDKSEWSDAGVDQAVAFIQADSLRKELYGYDMLIELGGILTKNFKDYEDAIQVYQNAIDLYPLNAQNPWTHDKIISLYWDNLQDEQATYTQRQDMFDRYRRGSDWARTNTDENLRNAADTLLNHYYYQNFLISASTVQQTKNRQSVQEALKVTQNYLTEFPKTESTPYVQYTMAALLEDSYSYDPQIQYLVDAYEAYSDVITRWGENKYQENSGQRMFDVAQTLVTLETGGQAIPEPTFRLGKEAVEEAVEEAPVEIEEKAPAPIEEEAVPDTTTKAAPPEEPIPLEQPEETPTPKDTTLVPSEEEDLLEEFFEELPEDTTTKKEQGFFELRDPYQDGVLRLTSRSWDALADALVQIGEQDTPIEIDTSTIEQIDTLEAAKEISDALMEVAPDTLTPPPDSLKEAAEKPSIDNLLLEEQPVDTVKKEETVGVEAVTPEPEPQIESVLEPQIQEKPKAEVPIYPSAREVPSEYFLPMPLDKVDIPLADYYKLLKQWREREEAANSEIMTLEGEVKDLRALLEALKEAKPAPMTKEQAWTQMDTLPLIKSEKMLLFAINTFTTQFPDHDLTSAMLYKGGRLLFDKQLYTPSRIYFEKIINDYPESKFVENSWLAVLDGYYESQDYAMTEATSKKIKASKVGGAALERAGLLHAASIFKAADVQKEKGDKRAAALEYRRAALDVPDFESADQSLFNSALEFMEIQDWKEAIVSYELLVHGYPKSERITTSYFNMGVIHRDNLNDPLKAAGVFDTLAFQHPGSKYDRTALSQASANYEAAKDWQNTIRVNKEYVKRFPKEEDTNQYLFETAGLFLKLGDERSAMQVYDEFALKFPNDIRTVQANYEQGEYYLQKGDLTRTHQYFEQTIASHQHLMQVQKRGYPEYASKALAQLTEWKFQDFKKIQYKLPKAKQDAAEAEKVARRKELLDNYRDLINYAKIESFQAFYRMAQLDEEIALAKAQQEMAKLEDPLKYIEQVRLHNDDVVSYYVGAQGRYKEMVGELEKALLILNETRRVVQVKYDSLTTQLTWQQKQSLQEGLTPEAKDSLGEVIIAVQEGITKTSTQLKDVNESVNLAFAYQDSCRARIPVIALHCADLQRDRFLVLLSTPDVGTRRIEKLFYRDQVFKNFIIPEIPLTVDSYLWAVKAADSSKVSKALADTARYRIIQIADSIFSQYQVSIDASDNEGYSFYTDKYERLLVQEDEDARAYGLYVDEMPDEIVTFQETMLSFSTGMQDAAMAFMQAAVKDEAGIPIYEKLVEKQIQHVLDNVMHFEELEKTAKTQIDKHRTKLEKTLLILEQAAMYAYETFSFNWRDYILELLNQSWEVPDNFQIKPQPITKQLVVKLVTYSPAVYGYLLGLKETVHYAVSDMTWKMSTKKMEGYERPDFDDRAFQPVMICQMPGELDVSPIEGVTPIPIGAYTFQPEVVIIDTLVPDPNYIPPTPVSPTPISPPPSDTTRLQIPEEGVLELDLEGREMEETVPDTLVPEKSEEQPQPEAIETEPEVIPESAGEDTVQIAPSTPPDTTGEAAQFEFLEEIEVPPAENDTSDTIQVPEEQQPQEIPEEGSAEEELLEETGKEAPLEETPEDTSQTGEQGYYPTSDPYLYGILDLTPPNWDALADALVQISTSDTADVSEGGIPPGFLIKQVEKTINKRIGEKVIYYRYRFNSVDRISYAELEITADDNWILYVNGSLVEEDLDEKDDWKTATSIVITQYLVQGDNVIAVEVNDPNQTAGGLWVRLMYNTIPEIPQDLSKLQMMESGETAPVKKPAEEPKEE